jgi:mono/diheme cytochrome c family protein
MVPFEPRRYRAKGTPYYLANHVFWLKMLLVLAFVALEVTPMVTFMRWRAKVAKNEPIVLDRKARLVRLHWVELGIVPLIVICATLMARGVGVVRPRGARNAATVVVDPIGEKLYSRNCSSCHQFDGRGLGGSLAANFVDDESRLAKSDAELLHSIGAGVPRTAMLGFQGRLSDGEQRAVLAYIRAKFGSATAPSAANSRSP